MSYWRKFFIVVLLALSLPGQSFAAAAMSCAAAGGTPVRHAEAVVAAAHAVDMDARGHGRHAARGDAGHAQACPACTSCCSGPGWPALPDVAASADTARSHGFMPPPTAAASFLTGGIERPPRGALV
ncbi:hypothetical protein C5O80_14390 [Burkholderia sp. SRS-46]|nr:hypothetical protein C5O80_14390 [Burkholderia sp. SRS-46]